MQIYIIAVGKELTGPYKQLADEYQKRLAPSAQIAWQLLPAQSSNQSPELHRSQESVAILGCLKSSDSVVLLDERGAQESNEQFAQRFNRLAGQRGRLVFIIGGAFGVSDEVRQRADYTWSLSKLVFPHKLVRVLLLEQLYRTQMVLRGHPYHHV